MIKEITAKYSTILELTFKSSIPDKTLFDYDEIISEDKKNYPTGKWFKYIWARYVEGKEWYEQAGEWVNDNGTSVSITEVYFNGDEYEDPEWNEDYTACTAANEDTEDEVQFTINDVNPETMTLTLTRSVEGVTGGNEFEVIHFQPMVNFNRLRSSDKC